MPKPYAERLRMGAALAALHCAGMPAPALAQEIESPDTPNWAVETIVVTGRRPGYATSETATATRTPTPLIRVPQSIQVLNRTLIEEQDRRTLADALVNVSGVTPAKTEETVLVQPIVRGFPAEIYIDGLPAFGGTAVIDPGSLVNTERVEVAKGPTAALYGGGLGAPLGGLINIVSKTPQPNAGGYIALRGGSYETAGLSFDVGNPLSGDDTLLARLTGEYQTAGSHIDEVRSKRLSLYPTLRFSPDERTEVVVRGQYNRIEQLEYSGLPAAITVTGDRRAIRTRFSGASDTPETTIKNALATADATHRFSDTVQLRASGRYYHSDFEEYSSFIFPSLRPPAPATPTRYPILTGYLPTRTNELTGDVSLLLQGSTAGVDHQLLVGLTLDRTRSRAASGFNFVPVGTIDYADPSSDVPFGRVPELTTFQTDRFDTLAVYAQDQVDVGRLHLAGSLRYTRLSLTRRETGLDRSYHRLTPRIGATFDLAPGVALFAGYAEGFRGTRSLAGGRPPVPETSRNLEGGLKLAVTQLGLSGTLAVFQLTRRNVPTADPDRPFASIQTGEQRARGMEADVVWEPTSALSILANYAYTDAEVTSDTRIPVGDALPRVPRHSGRVAARYRWRTGALKNLSMGAGVTAVSRREITLPNSISVPGYAIVDAQGSYDFGRFTLGLSLVNLGNTPAYDPYQYIAQAVVIPVQPRSAFLTLKTRF